MALFSFGMSVVVELPNPRSLGQRLARDKGGPFETKDPVDDVAEFAEPAERTL